MGPRTLIAVQMALAVVLVVAAMLMLGSLRALAAVDPGFDADPVVVLRPSPPSDRYGTDAERIAYYDRVLEAVDGRAEVSSVGAIQFLPMTPGGWWSTFSTPDRLLENGESPPRW